MNWHIGTTPLSERALYKKRKILDSKAFTNGTPAGILVISAQLMCARKIFKML
jgi:hypothetical protein